jgi:hypothetical protein
MAKQSKKSVEQQALEVAELGTEIRWNYMRLEDVALRVLQGLLSSGAVLKAYDSDEIVKASINYARKFLEEINKC